MVELDTSGIDQFLRELEEEQRSMNAWVQLKYYLLVQIVFSEILHGTPQWSGNLAANWYVGVNSMPESEHTIPEKAAFWDSPTHAVEPHQMGDAPAMSISEPRVEGLVFSIYDDVYIYNPTEIAPAVEAHSIYIRPVNLLDGRVVMTQYAADKYQSYNPL